MTIGNRNSVGGARRVPSAPSIETLMEMLSVQESALSSQNGGANSTFSKEDLAAGGGPSRLSITSQTDDTESLSSTPASTLGQRRPSDRSAVSAGRALLANKSPRPAKVTSDGTLCYEVKTSSGDPEQEGNKERRTPRRRRRTRAVQDAGSSSNDREQQPSAGPPRKNGSFLGRSRDSFLLKLVARDSTGC